MSNADLFKPHEQIYQKDFQTIKQQFLSFLNPQTHNYYSDKLYLDSLVKVTQVGLSAYPDSVKSIMMDMIHQSFKLDLLLSSPDHQSMLVFYSLTNYI